MSCSYADGLSKYENKGICGLPEVHDQEDDLTIKVIQLVQWIRESKHVVVHTGAGISTAAGIPDFRGPNGVWTLEEQGEKPQINISFDSAIPTKTHMAIAEFVKLGLIHFVVSQNVDGLHLRSGLNPEKFCELHGNMFLEKCKQCQRLFIRGKASVTVGQKCTNQACLWRKPNGRMCRGKLHDTILDWEDELPEKDYELADAHSRAADLSLCLGTTLQIVPSGGLPLLTKKNGGRLVICNLQPTNCDQSADVIIHDYIDNLIEKIAVHLGVSIPVYCPQKDPTLKAKSSVVEYSPLRPLPPRHLLKHKSVSLNNVLPRLTKAPKRKFEKGHRERKDETECQSTKCKVTDKKILETTQGHSGSKIKFNVKDLTSICSVTKEEPTQPIYNSTKESNLNLSKSGDEETIPAIMMDQNTSGNTNAIKREAALE
ncbi:NAD-dependent protein deacetylase Sirt6-like isoform X1 [Limulus polyphemus]|uniref:protein acetyllysine N-acetyltransferase n=1 Tax=Limulus polyphemus TaxID=6850 RepID=A0ABM1BEE3_LIMPO|nr:NAD-dependent protein deacetylase Sirt6-like isoform X1 [Limulus polyphemus]